MKNVEIKLDRIWKRSTCLFPTVNSQYVRRLLCKLNIRTTRIQHILYKRILSLRGECGRKRRKIVQNQLPMTKKISRRYLYLYIRLPSILLILVHTTMTYGHIRIPFAATNISRSLTSNRIPLCVFFFLLCEDKHGRGKQVLIDISFCSQIPTLQCSVMFSLLIYLLLSL